MSQDDKLLTSDDIVEIVPHNLIMYAIRGIMEESSLSISVMLDKDENNAELSRGTGKVFITDASTNGQAKYCVLLREWPDGAVRNRCSTSDLFHFEDMKKRVLSNPNCRGEIYWCSAGGLRDFVVPIVERESNTFVGIILGGQKRPEESPFAVWRRLKKLVAKPEYADLRSIPFWTLYRSYLQTEQASEGDLREMMLHCQRIAEEVAKPFTYFVRIRKEEFKKEVEHETIDTIYAVLNDARDLRALCGSMDRVLNELQGWVRFDWGMVLAEKGSRNGEQTFEVLGMAGRGIGPPEKVRDKQFAFRADAVHELGTPQRDPEFLVESMGSMVSGQAECWWIPMITAEGSILGGVALGSAPRHPNTKYDREHIEEIMPRLQEVVGRVAMQYGEFTVLEKAKGRTRELEETRQTLENARTRLEETLLKLTHQLKRPLIMVQGTLSNIRDIHARAPQRTMSKHVQSGILIAQHAELLCKGISKILAWEGGGRVEYAPMEIDVKAELNRLWEAMKLTSGVEELSFSYFGKSPTIKMDRDSFLYVFYVLIDNAMKYAKPHTTISLICAEERVRGEYALKVKSVGLAIPPGEKHRVFEKFWRAPEARQYDETGIGIGCWAARQHMELQGGELTLEVVENLSVFIVYPPKRFGMK